MTSILPHLSSISSHLLHTELPVCLTCSENKKTNWENTIKYPPFYADDIGMDLFILYQSLSISSEYNDPYDRDKNRWDISYIRLH